LFVDPNTHKAGGRIEAKPRKDHESEATPEDKITDMLHQLFAILALGVQSMGADNRLTELQAGMVPTIRCVYHLASAAPGVRSVEVYALNGRRIAVEYTFKDKKGRIIYSDIVLAFWGPDESVSYSGLDAHPKSDNWIEVTDFESKYMPQLQTKCRISPVLDDTLPFPSPRKDWRRIEYFDRGP
jgi:hypothetical protein